MNRKTKYIAVAACLIIALLLSALTTGNVEVDSGYKLTMGTFARIVAIAPNSRLAEKSIEAAFAAQQQIETLMSYHRPDSELNKVNDKAFEHPVTVHPMTFKVLQSAVEFSKHSEGAFDVTIGPLVNLWRQASDTNTPPTEEEIAQARSTVGYEKLILDPNELTVRFATSGMKLDLGGIAKGYAIDRSVQAMRDSGAIGGMVDIGGDISCFGSPRKGKPHWLIGLQDPNKPDGNTVQSDTLLVLKLAATADSEISVATSGNYQRFAVIKGKRHSHIIDTQSGDSSDKLASVTIIATNATTADALATAVSVLGVEKGMKLIEETPNTEAILIPAAIPVQLIKSTGAEGYIK